MNNKPFERILVPIDLSDFSNLALEYALQFHKKVGSQITLLYAEEISYLFTGDYPVGPYFENIPQLKKQAEKLVHDYVKQHVPPTVPVATIVVDDTPARAIIMTADNVDADLIIMGTHGRHGFRRAVIGSVAERVLRETKRPVITVTPKALGTGVDIRTILCPVNFTPVARQALETACSLAGALDAQLIVMNVVEKDEIATSSVESQFSGWVDPLVRRQTRYEQVLLAGDAAERVLEIANKVNADLIVVGAQHKFFSDATVIGTTTERITRFARQPVLTVVRPATVQEKKNEQVAAVA